MGHVDGLVEVARDQRLVVDVQRVVVNADRLPRLAVGVVDEVEVAVDRDVRHGEDGKAVEGRHDLDRVVEERVVPVRLPQLERASPR